jgi:RHS repeat-associated protein
MGAALKIESNRIDDSFYGVTSNTRNTIKENDVWTYFTDRNGLGDIIQKSNENEAHLFEYRGDKKLSKFTLLKNNNETSVDYFYDALGRRVAKLINTPTESFTNTYAYEADQDKILLGRNGLGEETLYVDGQGIDEHMVEINSSGVKAYVTNHLRTVLNSEATDSTRATGAFGEVLQSVNTISSSTEPVSYGFTGRQLDLEAGSIYYFRTRGFDSDSGRFLSLDTAGFSGRDANLYRYVSNNALLFSDPTGELGFIATAGIGAFLGAGVGALQAAINGTSVRDGVLIGATTGLAIGSGAFLFTTAATTAGVTSISSIAATTGLGTSIFGFTGNLAGQAIVTGEVSLTSAVQAGTIGLTAGAGSGALVAAGVASVPADIAIGLLSAPVDILGTVIQREVQGGQLNATTLICK